jgi:hypothetical protein
MNLSDFPTHIQARIKRENPDAFRRVEAAQPERAPLQALVGNVQVPKGCAPGVAVRVQLIALRCRLLDKHDNGPYSFKPLVDAIAASLGIDDGDERITFEYHQIKTKGQQGVIVQIERL